MKKIKFIGSVACVRCEKYIKSLAENREEIWPLQTAKRRREDNIKIDLAETIGVWEMEVSDTDICGFFWTMKQTPVLNERMAICFLNNKSVPYS